MLREISTDALDVDTGLLLREAGTRMTTSWARRPDRHLTEGRQGEAWAWGAQEGHGGMEMEGGGGDGRDADLRRALSLLTQAVAMDSERQQTEERLHARAWMLEVDCLPAP